MESRPNATQTSNNESSPHSVTDDITTMHQISDDDDYTTASENLFDSDDEMELNRLVDKVKEIVGLGVSSGNNSAEADRKETAAQYRHHVRRKAGDRNTSSTHAAHGLQQHGNGNTPASPEHHESSSPSMTMSVMSAESTVSDSADIDQILSDQEEDFEIHHAVGEDGCAKGFRVVRKPRPRSQQAIDEHEAANKVLDELDALFEPTLKKYIGDDVSDDEEEDEVKVKSR